jgi:hypothetical protein
MTIQTPREAAEALILDLWPGWTGAPDSHDSSYIPKIEAFIAVRDRALLAEDEAVIEAMVLAVHGNKIHGGKGFVERLRGQMREALAALCRHRGVE